VRLALVLACLVLAAPSSLDETGRESLGPCAARADRVGDAPITWHRAEATEQATVDRWCRAVGPPIVVSKPASVQASTPPPLTDLVVVTWNAHLAEGRLATLLGAVRAGRLTDGAPVVHFVLLVQELFRRGPDVPPMTPDARSAIAITARDPRTPDAADQARTLGLSFVYVPSMRNGAQLLEDRGNAIISTEPLGDLHAMELPFERQRRVAIGAAIRVATPSGVEELRVFDAHLEPLSAPSTLWVFRNPRLRQATAIVQLLLSSPFGASHGTVVGGDFNTIQGGDDEDAYDVLRTWSLNLGAEDRRSTHRMGRLDFLFFRSPSRSLLTTRRADEKYGSDHYPVAGRFVPQ